MSGTGQFLSIYGRRNSTSPVCSSYPATCFLLCNTANQCLPSVPPIVSPTPRLLQKSQLKHRHSCTIRDSLRDDISKVACALTARSERREEQKLSIGSLTQTIDLQEQSLLHLQKSHDQAKQNRRER